MLLCRYDTVHGKFNGKVEASDKGLIVEGHTIVFHQCKNPGGCSDCRAGMFSRVEWMQLCCCIWGLGRLLVTEGLNGSRQFILSVEEYQDLQPDWLSAI